MGREEMVVRTPRHDFRYCGPGARHLGTERHHKAARRLQTAHADHPLRIPAGATQISIRRKQQQEHVADADTCSASTPRGSWSGHATHSRSPEVVLEPHDVVFVEVVAQLYLDDDQGLVLLVHDAVRLTDGDIDGLSESSHNGLAVDDG